MHPYQCVKCSHKTSGIIIGNEDSRQCPICRSNLMRCNHCFINTSVTTAGDKNLCDHCKKPITIKEKA